MNSFCPEFMGIFMFLLRMTGLRRSAVKEQGGIVNKIELMLTETKNLEAIYRQKLTALTELKQSILQKAFAGELAAETVLKQVNG